MIQTKAKENDTYIPDAMDKISKILRDHRSGDIHPIDPKLMDFIQIDTGRVRIW